MQFELKMTFSDDGRLFWTVSSQCGQVYICYSNLSFLRVTHYYLDLLFAIIPLAITVAIVW